MQTTGTIIHGTRVISAFALAGAVVAGAFLGWIPAVAGAVDVHAVGAAIGGIFGVLANSKHLI